MSTSDPSMMERLENSFLSSPSIPASPPRRRLSSRSEDGLESHQSITSGTSPPRRHPSCCDIATTSSPEKPSRIPQPSRKASLAFPSHIDQKSLSYDKTTLDTAQLSPGRRQLVRSSSTYDCNKRSPPKPPSSEASESSSDSSRQSLIGQPNRLQRYPLRKKESPSKNIKGRSSLPASPQWTDVQFSEELNGTVLLSEMTLLQQRVNQLAGEKEQVDLEYSDLQWKFSQAEVALQNERDARAQDRISHATEVNRLQLQVEGLQQYAKNWEIKHSELAATQDANAITMAEFEEKEFEITRLWHCVDTMTSQLDSVATLSQARSSTNECTIEYMNALLESKTNEIKNLRGSLYDTVTLCFLHDLAHGHDKRIIRSFLDTLGSDSAAFKWIQDRFCNKILDDGPFSKLENCVGIIAIHPGASQILAGIVSEEEDGLILPSLELAMTKESLMPSQCISFQCVEKPNGGHEISLSDWKSRRRSLVEHITRKNIFSLVFEQLDIVPSKYKVVVVHKPLISRKDKAKLMQMLLHEFNVAALLLTTTAQMVLRANNLTTGLIVDIGTDHTHIVPIYDECIVEHAVVQLNIGGKALIEYMTFLFRTSTPPFAALIPELQAQIALTILQTKAYVAYDYEKAWEELKDPQSFDIKKDLAMWQLHADKELFQSTELLFQPNLHPQGANNGLHEAVLRSVDLCDPLIREDLLGSVILSGRVAKLPGLKRRLVKELVLSRQELLGKVHVDVPEHTEYHAYWGACTLAKYVADDMWTLSD